MERPPPRRRAPLRNAGWWWQFALTALVAPFYVGLFLVTAMGAVLGSRQRD